MVGQPADLASAFKDISLDAGECSRVFHHFQTFEPPEINSILITETTRNKYAQQMLISNDLTVRELITHYLKMLENRNTK